MTYEIKTSENQKYVIAKVRGDMTRQTGRKLAMDTEAYGMQHKINRLFLDLRESTNIDSVSSNYQFSAEDFPDPSMGNFDVMAYLVRPDDNSHRFVIISLSNTGYNARIFTDEHEAIEWLEDLNN